MRKLLWTLIPIVIVVGSLYLFLDFIRPRLSRLVVSQIEQLSKESLPVQIEVEKFEFALFLPKVILRQIKITPIGKGEGLGFDSIHIDSVRASLDLLQLVAGRIALSKIVLQGPDVDFSVDDWKSSGPPEALPIQWLFTQLRRLPLGGVEISQGHFSFNSEKMHFLVDLQQVNTAVDLRKDYLSLGLKIGNSLVLFDETRFSLKAETALTLNPKSLEVSEFKLQSPLFNLNMHGRLTDPKNLLISPSFQLDFDTEGDLTQIRAALYSLIELPMMTGEVQIKGDAEVIQLKKFKSNFQIKGNNVTVHNSNLGAVQVKGSADDLQVNLASAQISNDWGEIQVKDLHLSTPWTTPQSDWKISAKLSTDLIDLNDFLIRIGIGDISVESLLSGDFDCNGKAWPSPAVNCQGQLNSDLLEVRKGDGPKDTFVQIPSMSATGAVQIDGKQVAYQAHVQINEYQGESSGAISYDEGFKIQYQTPKLDLGLVKPLVGLKLTGLSSLQGETEGDSHGAIFFINFDSESTSFENYFLGHLKGKLSYKKGSLFFTDVDANVESTKYRGVLQVNLLDETLSADMQMPTIQASDIHLIFDKILPIPFDITGLGKAEVRVTGPLKVNQLTYDAKGSFQRVHVVGETFDSLNFDVTSKVGEFSIRSLKVRKGSGTLSMSGVGHPSGEVDFLVQSENLLLEESENISKMESNISGHIALSSTIKGQIREPEFDIKAGLNNVLVDDQDLPSSLARLKISKTYMEGQASLLGNRLKGDFRIPFDGNSPFKLKAQANDWNFTTAFVLIGSSNLLPEYESAVSGEIDLSSDKGGIFQASGKGEIRKLFLKRGELNVLNPKTMELNLKNGVLSLKNWLVAGGKTKISLEGQDVTKSDLRFNAQAEAELRLFQIFLPFLEELGGHARLSAQIRGAIDKPQILGQSSVENGFVRIKGFPHPFEKMDANAQFSHSRILISGFTGQLAGGNLSGDGQIDILGIRDLPLKISAKLDNANLSVPEGVRTRGSAEIMLSGNWFPFTLSGTYRVAGGLVTKEFEGSESTSATSKQSSYLPKVLLQEAFEPLELDLQILLDRPLPIKNSMCEGAISGQIQVKGRPQSPILLGKIALDKNSRLLFRDRSFEVLSTSVQFNDPNQLNPELFISARTRVNDYDISLLIQGTAKAPVIRLSSLPPLNEQDIISLLALGMTSSKIEKSIQAREQESNTATQIGNAILSNSPIAKGIQQQFGIDLQISSAYDDTKNITTQKYTASRNLSKKVKVSVSRTTGEQQASTEGKLQYKINPNVSAVATWENRENPETSRVNEGKKQGESILGLDLEFKKEFK